MNRIVLLGRLVKDPEIKVIEDSGKTVTRFILAVNRPFKNSSGEKVVDFIPVAIWGKRGEVIHEYAKKGDAISITGRLQTGSYEDKDGNRKYIYHVVADEFQFVERRKKDEGIS